MNAETSFGYRAPHKLVLLMAICELVEEGIIMENKVYLNADLEEKFKSLWKEYVDSDEEMIHDHVAEELFGGKKKAYPFKCNIANPFYHLSGEPFWTLKKSKKWKQRTSWSVAALKTDYEYAIIDEELFELITSEITRDRIMSLLLSMI